jgi:hypothetical protein
MRAVCAATLLVSATTRADELQLLWEQSPDLGVPYLSSTANSERGLAYNPATGHLLVVSRASSGGDIYMFLAGLLC